MLIAQLSLVRVTRIANGFQTIRQRYAKNQTDEFLEPIIVDKEGCIRGEIFFRHYAVC